MAAVDAIVRLERLSGAMIALRELNNDTGANLAMVPNRVDDADVWDVVDCNRLAGPPFEYEHAVVGRCEDSLEAVAAASSTWPATRTPRTAGCWCGCRRCRAAATHQWIKTELNADGSAAKDRELEWPA